MASTILKSSGRAVVCAVLSASPLTTATSQAVLRGGQRTLQRQSSSRMKIAVAQISCSLGNPEANLSKVHDFSRRAKAVGAELIVFPEMTDTGYSMPVIQKHANDWKSGFVASLQEIANQLSIAIVSGVSERDGPSIYNSQILVDAKGGIAAKYRKTHLYAVATQLKSKRALRRVIRSQALNSAV